MWLGEVHVGDLTRTLEGARFVLADEYLQRAGRPVLGQQFEDDPTGTYWVRQGVPTWFANLLPEGPLRELIAAREGVHRTRSFFLLGALGLDLPGAVVVRRSTEGADWPSDDEPEDSDEGDQPLKFSLAGVQLKFSAVLEGRGLTIPAAGRGGDWIVKLPDARHESVPENEHAIMQWARASGITVPEIGLVDVGEIVGLPQELHEIGGMALMVRRFDRDGGDRVHIEDFAQVLDLAPSQKYGNTNFETVARVLQRVSGDDDVDELVKRLVFHVLSGNGDAHVKNWSLIYPDGVQARLSPAYDLVSTVPYMRHDALALNLGGRRAFDQITPRVFGRFAEQAHLDPDRVRAVVGDQVTRSHAGWELVRAEGYVPAFVRKQIDERLSTLPLASTG